MIFREDIMQKCLLYVINYDVTILTIEPDN